MSISTPPPPPIAITPLSLSPFYCNLSPLNSHLLLLHINKCLVRTAGRWHEAKGTDGPWRSSVYNWARRGLDMENNNERTNKATYGDNSFSEYRNKSAWRMCFCRPDGETGDGRHLLSNWRRSWLQYNWRSFTPFTFFFFFMSSFFIGPTKDKRQKRRRWDETIDHVHTTTHHDERMQYTTILSLIFLFVYLLLSRAVVSGCPIHCSLLSSSSSSGRLETPSTS